MRAFLVTFIMLLAVAALSSPVRAACINPEGQAGKLVYNHETRQTQYCNGNEWVEIGRAGLPTKGLIAHWKLDETAGTAVTDTKGVYNGTYSGETVLRSAGGVSGTAIDFDGANDYVAFADHPGILT